MFSSINQDRQCRNRRGSDLSLTKDYKSKAIHIAKGKMLESGGDNCSSFLESVGENYPFRPDCAEWNGNGTLLLTFLSFLGNINGIRRSMDVPIHGIWLWLAILDFLLLLGAWFLSDAIKTPSDLTLIVPPSPYFDYYNWIYLHISSICPSMFSPGLAMSWCEGMLVVWNDQKNRNGVVLHVTKLYVMQNLYSQINSSNACTSAFYNLWICNNTFWERSIDLLHCEMTYSFTLLYSIEGQRIRA